MKLIRELIEKIPSLDRIAKYMVKASEESFVPFSFEWVASEPGDPKGTRYIAFESYDKPDREINGHFNMGLKDSTLMIIGEVDLVDLNQNLHNNEIESNDFSFVMEISGKAVDHIVGDLCDKLNDELNVIEKEMGKKFLDGLIDESVLSESKTTSVLSIARAIQNYGMSSVVWDIDKIDSAMQLIELHNDVDSSDVFPNGFPVEFFAVHGGTDGKASIKIENEKIIVTGKIWIDEVDSTEHPFTFSVSANQSPSSIVKRIDKKIYDFIDKVDEEYEA